jgi:poly(beta-D-mannuronate) lyase
MIPQRLKTALLCGIFFAAILTSPPAQALFGSHHTPLVMPYDVSPPQPNPDAPQDPPFSCAAPAAEPMRDLFFNSIYEGSDSHRATVNPEARDEYRHETADLRKFETAMVDMANAYLHSAGANPRIAECALDWLFTWAKGKALLGEVNEGGIYQRQWILGSLSSAYAQIKAAPGLDPRKKKTVEKWLSACARTVAGNYKDATQKRQQNNHLYWAAWGVTVTGIALGNPNYYRWGISRARYALTEQVTDDGALPLEMARGPKALQYHIVALEPLIFLAEAAERNGDNLYSIRNGILHRMVERVLAGMNGDKFFEEKSGFKQTPASDLYPGYYAWMEIYDARFPNSGVKKWLHTMRPLYFRRIGGDMTFLRLRE